MIRPESIYFGESTQLMNSLYLWQCLNACILSIHMDVMDDGYDACIEERTDETFIEVGFGKVRNNVNVLLVGW